MLSMCFFFKHLSISVPISFMLIKKECSLLLQKCVLSNSYQVKIPVT